MTTQITKKKDVALSITKTYDLAKPQEAVAWRVLQAVEVARLEIPE